MNAGLDNSDDLGIHKRVRGFIFLSTPHKGCSITRPLKLRYLLGRWNGSDVGLLDVLEPGSEVSSSLHIQFLKFLNGSCGLENTVCFFAAMREAVYGFPITHVSAYTILISLGA